MKGGENCRERKIASVIVWMEKSVQSHVDIPRCASWDLVMPNQATNGVAGPSASNGNWSDDRACRREDEGLSFAHPLRHEDRNHPGRFSSILSEPRVGHLGDLPQALSLRPVGDLAHPHLLHHRQIAKLHLWLGTQVVDPNRILGCSAHRADQNIVGAILDTHQRRLSNGSGFVAYVSDDDDRQSGIAQRVAFGPVRSLVELDLLAHPISRTRDVFRHWLSFMDRIFKSPFYERRYIASAPSLSNTAELSESYGLVGILDGRVGRRDWHN